MGVSVERNTMSLQDWGPGDCLQVEQVLRTQGRKARNLQNH